MNTYEGLFIFLSSVKDEALDKALVRVDEEMKKLGGEILERDIKGKRFFARPMQKQEAGVYVKTVFSFDPAQLTALTGRLKLIEEIFRVQIVKLKSWEKRKDEPVAETAKAEQEE